MSLLPSPHAEQQLRLQIAGMSCGHCVTAVTNALQAVPGVRVEQVVIGAASVTTDAGVSADAVADAIRDAGYDVTVV